MTLGWQDDGSFLCPPEPPQGTLAGWREAANMLCAAGCEAQTMALLASFAAPLMALFPTEGSAVVSIWGGRGRGKSTALTAASTVWGAVGTTNDDASNPGIPCVNVSLANRDPVLVRRRLTETSTPTLRISTSGMPLLAALFPPPEIAPGLEFEVAVPKALKEHGDKNRIESQLRMNRGHAGPLFVDRVGVAAAWCEDKLAEKVALMRDETGLGDERRFQMRAIAACWVAAMLCADRILEIDPDRIARWAMTQTFPKRSA